MKVSRLADKTDEIIPKVLEAGAEVVEDKVRSNLQSVIGSGTKYDSRSTGELLRSLGTSPALQDRNGDFDLKVGFSEPRSDGSSNAKIATILEYGKSGQPAKPFLKPARSASKNACMAVPDKGFKLTLEMLRRKPDSALVWYEDFQDYGVLETDYWTVRSGSFEVWRSDEYSMERVYSQLEGHGELAWQYDGFSELHLRARLAFPANGSGRAGVFCGSLFCCLNYDTQAVELYNGSTLLSSYSQEIARTSSADLRVNPSMYTVEMRVRGNRVRVYSGSSYTLRFTATASGFSGGYAGYRSDNTTVCELLRLGDAWTYEPYERFDVEMPDGSFKSYGRISRFNCTWDEEFQVFTLTSDVEETSTRSEDISLDYDFFHSDLLEISCGGNYTARIIPKDINIWISRLFLGDADGFSILYYQDVDSLVYWANQAAYRWKLRGMCMWSLGQEDMRLWEWLPKQI